MSTNILYLRTFTGAMLTKYLVTYENGKKQLDVDTNSELQFFLFFYCILQSH